LVAFGSAGGATDPRLDTQSTLAPAVQLGYFQHFANSRWLWGAKFSYSYPGATASRENVAIPQVGSYTSSTPDTFTGNVVVRDYKTSIGHQLALMPFFGRSFDKGFAYFGAGPTVTQSKTSLNDVIGFADINGGHVNITGTPSNFSSSPWLFGAQAMVGATYFFAPSWFLDFSYAYGIAKGQKVNFSTPFASSTDGYDDIGILSGHYSGSVITQSLTISINKAF
jgi:opacity protein-like surface antigen